MQDGTWVPLKQQKTRELSLLATIQPAGTATAARVPAADPPSALSIDQDGAVHVDSGAAVDPGVSVALGALRDRVTRMPQVVVDANVAVDEELHDARATLVSLDKYLELVDISDSGGYRISHSNARYVVVLVRLRTPRSLPRSKRCAAKPGNMWRVITIQNC